MLSWVKLTWKNYNFRVFLSACQCVFGPFDLTLISNPLRAGHAFFKQWHVRKRGLFISTRVYFPIWRHPWMDDGTNRWMNRLTSHMMKKTSRKTTTMSFTICNYILCLLFFLKTTMNIVFNLNFHFLLMFFASLNFFQMCVCEVPFFFILYLFIVKFILISFIFLLAQCPLLLWKKIWLVVMMNWFGF
jgi:hypothetical protein